jgi:hypothetical protein
MCIEGLLYGSIENKYDDDDDDETLEQNLKVHHTATMLFPPTLDN